jgi:hypothetical protein
MPLKHLTRNPASDLTALWIPALAGMTKTGKLIHPNAVIPTRTGTQTFSTELKWAKGGYVPEILAQLPRQQLLSQLA